MTLHPFYKERTAALERIMRERDKIDRRFCEIRKRAIKTVLSLDADIPWKDLPETALKELILYGFAPPVESPIGEDGAAHPESGWELRGGFFRGTRI